MAFSRARGRPRAGPVPIFLEHVASRARLGFRLRAVLAAFAVRLAWCDAAWRSGLGTPRSRLRDRLAGGLLRLHFEALALADSMPVYPQD